MVNITLTYQVLASYLKVELSSIYEFVWNKMTPLKVAQFGDF
jgi:hypothetical protein